MPCHRWDFIFMHHLISYSTLKIEEVQSAFKISLARGQLMYHSIFYFQSIHMNIYVTFFWIIVYAIRTNLFEIPKSICSIFLLNKMYVIRWQIKSFPVSIIYQKVYMIKAGKFMKRQIFLRTPTRFASTLIHYIIDNFVLFFLVEW